MALAGRYLANGKVLNKELNLDMNFIVDGDKLTGTVFARDTEVEILDGKADGDNFSCALKVPTPMGKTKIKLKGKVEGDDISFSVNNPILKSSYTGKRVTE